MTEEFKCGFCRRKHSRVYGMSKQLWEKNCKEPYPDPCEKCVIPKLLELLKQ